MQLILNNFRLNIILIILISWSSYAIIDISMDHLYWNFNDFRIFFASNCPTFLFPEEKLQSSALPDIGYGDPIRQTDVVWKKIQIACGHVESFN